MSSDRYIVYLSHSWLPEHVDLNLAVWQELWAICDMVVDEQVSLAPPYHVSRLEHLMRRSDLFVAVLAPSDGGSDEPSPYQLFELSLASRAGIPALVLCADGLTKPDWSALPDASIQVVDVDASAASPEHGLGVSGAVQAWLEHVTAAARPPVLPSNDDVALLLGETEAASTARPVIEQAVARRGRQTVDLAEQRDEAQLAAALLRADLLVAVVDDLALADRYIVAHELAVPTIRMTRATDVDPAGLPPVLLGHQAGFQLDLVPLDPVDRIEAELSSRFDSIDTAGAVLIAEWPDGREYFERRRT